MRTYLLLPFVAALLSATPAYAAFSDVPSNHPNADAISDVEAQGIVSGYADGTFKPDQQINRAEFTKIAIGAMFTQQAWTTCDPSNIFSFHDASRTDWYSPFLCVAVQNQVIQGYADGTFRPTQNISFAEAAKILVQADRENADGNPQYDRSLPTVNGPWYASYVQYLQNRGAIPLSITHFDQLITRGEMAEMIYRLKAGITNKSSQTYDSLAAASSASDSMNVTVYLYNSADVTVPCDTGYDCDYLYQPTKVSVPHTTATLKASLQALLDIRENAACSKSNPCSDLYLSKLTVSSATIVDGVAHIKIVGDLVLAGDMSGFRAIQEIQKTILQFPSVKTLDVTINGTSLKCLADGSGLCQ